MRATRRAAKSLAHQIKAGMAEVMHRTGRPTGLSVMGLVSGRWRPMIRGLLIFAVVTAVYLAGWLEIIVRHLIDARFTLLSRPVTGEVVLVEIDSASLSELDVWPWPRAFHARLVDTLAASGATRIAFDIDFSARSAAAPDAAFAAALERAEGRVILPVFQAEATVGAAVRSILEGELTDLELIAVDDGSTDASAERVEAVARDDERVRLVRRPHGGVAAAANAAVAEARAPLIARMDADDVAHPQRLLRQVELLESAGLDVVGSQVRVVEPGGGHVPAGLHLGVWLYQGTKRPGKRVCHSVAS